MVNLKSQCSKQTLKEYKTRHDWVEKVIQWELGKRLKFDPTKKVAYAQTEALLKNEIHKKNFSLRGFDYFHHTTE